MVWVREFTAPQFNNLTVEPQGICFLDANTLLITSHQANSRAVLQMVNTSGVVLGQCSSTEYRHPGSVRVAPNGDVWIQDFFATGSGGNGFTTGTVDLESCFASGVLEITPWALAQDVQTVAGLDFASLEGVDYVLLHEYSTTGTPWLYVFLQSQMSAPASAATRVKRFSLGLRSQDVAHCNGRLYSSSNANGGAIIGYDFATMMALPDGSVPSSVQVVAAPNQFGEALAFHPTTNRCWMMTEFSSRAAWSQDIVPQVIEPGEPGIASLQFFAGWRV